MIVSQEFIYKSTESSVGCTVWHLQEEMTCDISPSHIWGGSVFLLVFQESYKNTFYMYYNSMRL